MVRDVAYQPDRGDFAYLDFSPQAGTEQAGRRPGLILSPREFNIGTGLAVACPLTSTRTGGRFEVALPRGAKLKGVVLAHHFRTIDWLVRDVKFHSKASQELLLEVLARIESILSIKLE